MTKKTIVQTQGLFYLVTGLWSLFHVRGFMFAVGNKRDPFKTETNGVLFTILGMLFLVGSTKGEDEKLVANTCLGVSLLTAWVDLKYLLKRETSAPFWLDFFEEATIALLLLKRKLI